MKDLKQLIRESINEYIKAIDEAGHKAGMEARMAATQEAIDKRKKMTALDELDEDMKGMIDEKKVKDINAEVKALEKSLAKLQKQLDKLTSKANKGEKAEEKPEEIIDEISLGENEGEERYDEEGNVDPNGMYDAGANYIGAVDTAMDKAEYDKDTMNESFLYMQKLAGVITEGQYKAKKVLNEDVISLTYNTDPDDLEYVKNVLKKAKISAKVKAGTFDDEVEITVDKALRKKAIAALNDAGFDI